MSGSLRPSSPPSATASVFARGSADDKGQLYMHVKALEAHMTATGKLPVNVIVLAEGEEEVGSENLVPFVKEHARAAGMRHVVISDSNMFDEGLPSVLFSLRGLAYFEIHVKGPRSDLHSGQFGGSVVNPGNALSADHRVAP